MPYRAGYDPTSQEQVYIAKTQGHVKGKLRDRSGARFRHMFVSHKVGAPVVCGQVNAKKGFGGFIGWQRFIAAPVGDLVFLEEQMAAAEMNKTWSQIC